jgi:hypothetical protein
MGIGELWLTTNTTTRSEALACDLLLSSVLLSMGWWQLRA